MSDKTYMFQYYKDSVVEDTGLMTLEEVRTLYDKHILDFYEAVNSGLQAEIAIWKNCTSDACYKETLVHYHTEDCIIDDGTLIEVIKIPVKMRFAFVSEDDRYGVAGRS